MSGLDISLQPASAQSSHHPQNRKIFHNQRTRAARSIDSCSVHRSIHVTVARNKNKHADDFFTQLPLNTLTSLPCPPLPVRGCLLCNIANRSTVVRGIGFSLSFSWGCPCAPSESPAAASSDGWSDVPTSRTAHGILDHPHSQTNPFAPPLPHYCTLRSRLLGNRATIAHDKF